LYQRRFMRRYDRRFGEEPSCPGHARAKLPRQGRFVSSATQPACDCGGSDGSACDGRRAPLLISRAFHGPDPRTRDAGARHAEDRKYRSWRKLYERVKRLYPKLPAETWSNIPRIDRREPVAPASRAWNAGVTSAFSAPVRSSSASPRPSRPRVRRLIRPSDRRRFRG
jgi:hypothetical protein